MSCAKLFNSSTGRRFTVTGRLEWFGACIWNSLDEITIGITIQQVSPLEYSMPMIRLVKLVSRPTSGGKAEMFGPRPI